MMVGTSLVRAMGFENFTLHYYESRKKKMSIKQNIHHTKGDSRTRRYQPQNLKSQVLGLFVRKMLAIAIRLLGEARLLGNSIVRTDTSEVEFGT